MQLTCARLSESSHHSPVGAHASLADVRTSIKRLSRHRSTCSQSRLSKTLLQSPSRVAECNFLHSPPAPIKQTRIHASKGSAAAPTRRAGRCSPAAATLTQTTARGCTGRLRFRYHQRGPPPRSGEDGGGGWYWYGVGARVGGRGVPVRRVGGSASRGGAQPLVRRSAAAGGAEGGKRLAGGPPDVRGRGGCPEGRPQGTGHVWCCDDHRS